MLLYSGLVIHTVQRNKTHSNIKMTIKLLDLAEFNDLHNMCFWDAAHRRGGFFLTFNVHSSQNCRISWVCLSGVSE